MKWLLQLYPARWRERYGEEFGAVLASQRASVGMVWTSWAEPLMRTCIHKFKIQIRNQSKKRTR
jgi:hypothetical protein